MVLLCKRRSICRISRKLRPKLLESWKVLTLLRPGIFACSISRGGRGRFCHLKLFILSIFNRDETLHSTEYTLLSASLCEHISKNFSEMTKKDETAMNAAIQVFFFHSSNCEKIILPGTLVADKVQLARKMIKK